VEQLHNLKQLLVTACKVLANEGITDAFGHISVRIPGTDRFYIPESLGDCMAVLMRGHGSTVVGLNVQQAAVTAIYLEETAKLTYRARCIGTPICFTDEEVGRLSEYVSKENSFNRAWDYYVGRLSHDSK